MGNSHSEKQAIPRSPSAAFGRIRIDSPDARRIHARIRSERSLVGLAEVRSSGTLQQLAYEKVPSVFASEHSPLIRRLPASPAIKNLPIELAKEAPPWWIVPALICATCYALYNVFIKLGSSSIHPVLGGVVLQFVAAILGSILLLCIVAFDGVDELNYDLQGIKWSILAGVAVGAAEILSFIVSGLGVPSSKSIPVIIGGSVGIGCAIGLAILHEVLGARGLMGVALIVVGVALVGTDPNTSLS